MLNAGTLLAILRLKDEFSGQMQKAQQQFERAGASMQRVGAKMQGVGRSMIPLSLAIGGVGIAAIKMSVDLNKSMANVASLIPQNTERVNELKAAVQDLAIEHGKSTDDLAGGLYQVISAYGDTADTLKILETNSKAARAGVASTMDAINLTSAVTKAYGDTSAAATNQVADLAFQTVKLGQTTFPELAASIGNVAPVAAQLNVSQRELAAGFATLTGVTGNTATVSTQLAAILRSMIKPTEGMETAMGKLGYTSAATMIQELGMVGALEQLIATTDGSEKSIGELFGRVEGMNAVFALTGAQADVFREKLAAMGVASGALDEAFKEQTEGINAAGFMWDQFRQRITVVGQRLGDKLAPAFMSAMKAAEPLLDWLVKAADWFGRLPQPVQTTVIAVAGLAAAAGPLLIALGTMIQLGGGAITMLPKLAAALFTAKAGAVALAGAVAVVAYKLTEMAIEAAGARPWLNRTFLDLYSLMTKGRLATELERQALEDVGDALEYQASNTGKSAEATKKAVAEAEKFAAELDKIFESAGSAAGAVEELDETATIGVKTWGEYSGAISEANVGLEGWSRTIDMVDGPLANMNIRIGEAAQTLEDEVPSGAEASTSAVSKLSQSLEDLANMSILAGGGLGSLFAQAGGALSGIEGLFGGEGLTANFKEMFSGGILSGLSAAIPAVGALLGPAVAGFKALLGKIFGGPDIARDVARDMGPRISEGLERAIRDAGGPAQLAIADIFREGFASGTATADMLAQEMGDLFSFFERGEITKPELIGALEESVPMLIERFKELGPAGEEQLQRIISAAERFGVTFDGLDELMQSTFAPETMESIAETFKISNDEVRSLAEKLGVDVQTNLERMASTAGLSVDEFRELADVAKNEFGVGMEDIDDLAASMGVSVAELAEALGVNVKEGSEKAEESFGKNEEYMEGAADYARILADELERAARASDGINIPTGGAPVEENAAQGMPPTFFPRGGRITVHPGEVATVATARDVQRQAPQAPSGNVIHQHHWYIDGATFLGTEEEFIQRVGGWMRNNRGGINTELEG